MIRQFKNFVSKIDQLLVQPSPHLSEGSERTRARILAHLSLLILAVVIPAFLYAILSRPLPDLVRTLPEAIPSVIVFSTCYLLSRTRYAKAGAVLLELFMLSMSILVGVNTVGKTSTPMTMLSSLLTLMGAVWLLLDSYMVIGISVLALVEIFILPILRPTTRPGEVTFLALIIGIGGIIAASTTINRERLARQAKEKTDSLASLYQIAIKMASSTIDLDILLETAIQLLQESFPSNQIDIILADDDNGQFVFRASSSVKPQDDRFSPLPKDEGIVNWVIKSGQPILLNDVTTDQRYQERNPNTRSELSVPLFVGAGTLGAINLESTRLNAYTLDDQHFLETLAPLLAFSIVNASLYRRFMQAAESLRDSEANYRLLYDEAPDGYHSLDSDGYILEVNQAWLDMLGYAIDDVVGRAFREFLSPESRASFDANFLRLKESGRVDNIEYIIEHANGDAFPIMISGRILYDESGAVRRTHCIVHDITERRLYEARLQDSESRYRSLFEDSPISLWEEDFSQVRELLEGLQKEGVSDFHAYFAEHPEFIRRCVSQIKILDVNQATLELLEAESKGALYQALDMVLAKNLSLVFPNELSAFLKGETRYQGEGAHTTLNGRQLHTVVSVSIAPGYQDTWSKVFVSVIDVTELKRAEAKLREQDALLQAVSDATSRLLTLTDHNRAIGESLHVIGEAVNADRVYIFENHPHPDTGEIAASQRFEWTRQSVAAQLDNPELQNVSYLRMGLERWYNTLKAGRPIHGPIEGFPEQERELLATRDVLSLLVVPISIDNQFWGFIGFTDCRTKREWTRHEGSILTAMAGNLGGVLVRKRTEEELAQARDQALEASRLKSEFLATISHELRTPLNSIIGFTQIIVDGIVGDLNSQQAEFMNDILSSAEHLLALINDVLDMAKIEAGQMEISPEPFEIGPLIHEAVDTVRMLVNQKQQELVIEIDPELTELVADRFRIKQVLLNLLSNANKFTPAGGHITLTARQIEKEALLISVIDTGIGLTDSAGELIFQEFRQVDSSSTRTAGGTGLGLPISRRLIELHGGAIWVESTPGEGSTFSFILPLAGPPSHLARLIPDPDDTLSLADREPTHTVFVVEDDRAFNNLLSFYFNLEGYDVVQLFEATHVVEHARTVRPILITLDIRLPGTDGWMLLKTLKGDPETADIPVVIISALEDSDIGFSLGAEDCLVKPLERAQLKRVLAHLHNRDKPTRIIVIDDTPEIGHLIAMILPKREFVVEEFSHPEYALEKILESPPDILVLDLHMPSQDGVKLLRHLRTIPSTKNLPVIIFSAYDVTPDESEVIEKEARAYIRKGESHSIPQLVAEIRRVVQTLKADE